MHVFAFDRDDTIDVNPHPRESPMVPLSWVTHLAHETHHEVWATGNQTLTMEADIPGVDEALNRLDRDPGDNLPMRRERVLMLGDLFPDANSYVVVDDVDLSHLDGWDHYYPWDFVEAVRAGDIGIDVDRSLAGD